jgi:hypothetical protein
VLVVFHRPFKFFILNWSTCFLFASLLTYLERRFHVWTVDQQIHLGDQHIRSESFCFFFRKILQYRRNINRKILKGHTFKEIGLLWFSCKAILIVEVEKKILIPCTSIFIFSSLKVVGVCRVPKTKVKAEAKLKASAQLVATH